jgi:predicted flap endonuclease-1-like 5' DNA nuclease
MSSAKDYESLLKDYDQAQAQLARTRLREKTAKKNVKEAEKNDASKAETEICRLELEIAKAKRKARKAGAAIAKIRIKQWIKANAKQEKSYKLTLNETATTDETEPIAQVAATEEVVTKRKYTRKVQAEAETTEARDIQVEPEVEGRAGTFTSIETAAEAARTIVTEEPKKTRRPRRSSAEVAAEKEAAQAALRESGQDFTIIEGIGPAVTKLLHSVGVKSFQDLAAADLDMLKGLMKARRNNIADPTTWAQQAQMVIDNDREGLEQLQNELKRNR